MLPLCAESDHVAVHTVGGVISNGETIMQIVPRADDLVTEAKVASNDIDLVAVERRRWGASHGRQPADHTRGRRYGHPRVRRPRPAAGNGAGARNACSEFRNPLRRGIAHTCDGRRMLRFGVRADIDRNYTDIDRNC